MRSAKPRAIAWPLAGEHAGEDRHEGGVERALCKQAAEQVGQAQSDEKGVGNWTRAKSRRNQQIPDEAQHPAGHGEAAYGGDGAE